MKMIVFSDSHGNETGIINAIKAENDADCIVFLGDGERDFEAALAQHGIYPYGPDESFKIYQVCGNCDIFSSEPAAAILELSKVKIFISHGFEQQVKYGYEKLAKQAADRGCKLALFGHTHLQHYGKIGDVCVFNPGAVRNGSYGVIDFLNGSFTCAWKKI